jgi:hypothetical protein
MFSCRERETDKLERRERWMDHRNEHDLGAGAATLNSFHPRES